MVTGSEVMIPGWLWAVGTVVAVAIYGYWALPFPFFEVVKSRAAGARAGVVIPVASHWARRLRRLFPEPRRPYRSWRGIADPYAREDGGDSMPGPFLIFRSPLHLLILPLRLPLDHLLSPLLNGVNLLSYLLLLAAAYLHSAWACRRGAQRVYTADEIGEKRAFLRRYLQVYCDPEQRGGLHILAEPGYFMFKVTEGWQFHTALRRFGARHPNADIGIDDGSLSALHLEQVDYIDVALDTYASEWPLAKGAKRYVERRVGYIEGQVLEAGHYADLYLIHVVDHISRIEPAMQAMADTLRSGGRVFFSGLSHSFRGAYLERFCASGHVWNNRPLEWWRDLAEQAGLRMVYGSYCMAPPASTIWKLTYPFAMKTRVWEQLGGWLGRTPGRRRLAARLLEGLWLGLFVREEALLSRSGIGLNFMLVLEKP